MKLSCATTIFALMGSAAAFAPATNNNAKTFSSALHMSDPNPKLDAPEEMTIEQPGFAQSVAGQRAIEGQDLNGWKPDSSQPCYGLPGAIAPMGYFDPIGLCEGRDLVGVKRFREAEVMHSRVAMMAVVGYLIGENTPTITYGFDTPTIANDQIPEVPFGVMFPFFLAINICEAYRASKGWVEPGLGPLFTLRENYYPGDLGFDPLGLKPEDPAEFATMQAKELSNGRLAMLAVAGFCAQELANGQPVLADIGL